MGGTITAVSGIPGPDLAAVLHRAAGLPQLWELLLAFALSSAIGVERELRNKSAGLRTHTLVGVGSALFVEVSAHGFADARPLGYDPSRIAAQVVSGIGFLGGGLIFVRRDSVSGLTAAAVVWVTCAVGMACAAGLPLLALAVTVLHFVVVFGYTPLVRRYFRTGPHLVGLDLTYLTTDTVLPRALVAAAGHGFRVVDVSVHHLGRDPTAAGASDGTGHDLATATRVALRLEVRPGRVACRSPAPPVELQALVVELAGIDGMVRVAGGGAGWGFPSVCGDS